MRYAYHLVQILLPQAEIRSVKFYGSYIPCQLRHV